MVEDDVLLRQIHRAAELLARWAMQAPEASTAESELDALSQELFGLDLGTLRRIPPSMLPALLPEHAPGGAGRWVLAARFLVERAHPDERAARLHQAERFVDAALATRQAIHPELLADTQAAIARLRNSRAR